ncbi:MAG: (2Fe-2S) ferredoxin domain-containing protein [Myxococcota bacterium]|jgi:predicted metal-binding protein|nr:(2Fe-2S) ferredoxin domain-containing protein [Myxococcota bacterium]
MRAIAPKWTRRGLVLVCNNQRDPAAGRACCDANGGTELRNWLKSRLKAEGEWGPVRVVTTGCLDVCPERGVVVAIQLDGRQEILLADPDDDREALYQVIRERLDSVKD